jgi:hypothetical protein
VGGVGLVGRQAERYRVDKAGGGAVDKAGE